jgi:phosphopantothenoylcysteine decarboxylase/phosphopantothenate--cysteine ligase
MDEDMWQHPSTVQNLNKIRSYNNKIIPVEKGELASGLYGEGRMAEPEQIVEYLQNFFFESHELQGENVLVSAGPTHEAIDPVRYISNHSSGKMGVAIAEEFLMRGATVTLVLGPSNITMDERINILKVKTAAELESVCMDESKNATIIVMAAAVADYTPQNVSLEKIKKKDELFQITLKKTTDILKRLGEAKPNSQILVGFALETNNEKENALQKLKQKNADMIVLNSLKEEGAGFGVNTNKITIFDKKGNEYKFDKKTKKEVAWDIVNTIIQYKNA